MLIALNPLPILKSFCLSGPFCELPEIPHDSVGIAP